ncbi:hypothetical protein DRQ33_00600 [bacterium]|nr:MAG: hypothetical protein DRQ33_00600 [bacterium]
MMIEKDLLGLTIPKGKLLDWAPVRKRRNKRRYINQFRRLNNLVLLLAIVFASFLLSLQNWGILSSPVKRNNFEQLQINRLLCGRTNRDGG